MPTQRPPEDPGRPTPREAIAKATAAAGPKVAKAVEAAGPKVEKAALSAGKLLGTLRERAKDTAKQFSEAYGGPDTEDKPAAGTGEPDDPAGRPRPRPTRK
ncbi:MAG: hypothetical protein ABR571_07370 [Jatrophihabitans sp.]|uniref:hypothetical protein n=1 Tax=Jatrophihabitans sp. TaxID=1932789 RepID=UPI003911B163